MRLQTLELLKRRQIGIGIIEVENEPDGHQIVVEVIEE
jgi:hypothetical protein